MSTPDLDLGYWTPSRLGQSLDAEAEAEDALRAAVEKAEPDWLSAEMQYDVWPTDETEVDGERN